MKESIANTATFKNEDIVALEREGSIEEFDPISFIKRAFGKEKIAQPTTEEIERAMKRTEKDIAKTIELLRLQILIKMESEEMKIAMDLSLRESDDLRQKRKREEEEDVVKDPVNAFKEESAIEEDALESMFNGKKHKNTNEERVKPSCVSFKEALELCELERRCKRWWKSALETIEDVFSQIGDSVIACKTTEDVELVVKNSLEMLKEQVIRMPVKAGGVPEIFFSEEQVDGKKIENITIEFSSSEEEEEEEEED